MVMQLNGSKKNKKIQNATRNIYDGIVFRSKLETECYKLMCLAGFCPQYEKMKVTVWKGFTPTVPCYVQDKRTGLLRLEGKKVLDITYTPDFTFSFHDILIIIEVKGKPNDTFPLKKKLFRKWMEEQEYPCVYFEIHSKANMIDAINIIKQYEITD